MTAAEKVRNFGVLWVLVVAGGAFALEPALRNGVFVSAIVLLLVGWVLIAGNAGSEPVTDPSAAGGLDREALTATGTALVRCSEEFSSQFGVTRGELGRAQQIFSDAIAKLIDSFNAMLADHPRLSNKLMLRLLQMTTARLRYATTRMLPGLSDVRYS